jgi:hypothetical protein
MTRLAHVCVASLLLSACGSDTPDFGPETDATPTQETGIASTEQSLIVFASADTQGPATAGAALGIAGSALLLIASDQSERLGIGRDDSWPPNLRRLNALPGALLEDCAVVTSNTVVWTNCTQNGFTINGMVNWVPGHVTVDLQIDGAIQGFAFHYALSGGIAVTESSIKGDMTLTASASGSGLTYNQTVHSQIDVQIADECITSGSLIVTVTGSGDGARNGAVQILWTGCHAFRVRNA